MRSEFHFFSPTSFLAVLTDPQILRLMVVNRCNITLSSPPLPSPLHLAVEKNHKIFASKIIEFVTEIYRPNAPQVRVAFVALPFINNSLFLFIISPAPRSKREICRPRSWTVNRTSTAATSCMTSWACPKSEG